MRPPLLNYSPKDERDSLAGESTYVLYYRHVRQLACAMHIFLPWFSKPSYILYCTGSDRELNVRWMQLIGLRRIDERKQRRLHSKRMERLAHNQAKTYVCIRERETLYCNVHNYGFGLGRHYTVVLRSIHPHNHENPQTAKRALKSPYFIVIVPFSTVKVSTLYLIFLTFSRFCT
jgi:hypothetical protein